MAAHVQDTSDWLRAQGIAYVFVIAPDKHVIYREYMPETIRRSAISRIDKLVSRSASTPLFVCGSAAAARAGRERLYHRADTHWNDRGALVAARTASSML